MSFHGWTVDLDADEIHFDLELPAGDAVWLAQVEHIDTVPDTVPEEWL